MNDTARGPLGDARPDASGDGAQIRPSLPQEKVEDRENVGSVTPEDYPAKDREIASPAGNRGKRPSAGSGEVSGSGAGAGGGGGSEDYDSDPVGGGGAIDRDPARPKPSSGADAPVGGTT